jgi:mono/diheme cytochrome c family protein
VLFALFAAAGCAQQADLAYVPRAELKDFPEKHRQQISAALESYFGTPALPRMMRVAAEQPEEAEAPALDVQLDRQHLTMGQAVYQQQCQGCHGVTGDGQGPAAVF